MICPICRKNEATADVVRDFGSYICEGKVCPTCLKIANSLSPDSFYNLFYVQLNRSCRCCGRRLGEILNTMICGCPACYDEFKQELAPLIDSVQRRKTE